MPITCQCGSVLKDEKGLKKHQRLHCKVVARPQSNEANLTCPDCDRVFPKLQSLNQHRRHAHSQEYNQHMQEQATSTRKRAEWTMADEQKLAKLELKHKTQAVISASAMRLIADELGRTVESIKSRRKLLAYKKLVKDLENELNSDDEINTDDSSSASTKSTSDEDSFNDTFDDIACLEPITQIDVSQSSVKLCNELNSSTIEQSSVIHTESSVAEGMSSATQKNDPVHDHLIYLSQVDGCKYSADILHVVTGGSPAALINRILSEIIDEQSNKNDLEASSSVDINFNPSPNAKKPVTSAQYCRNKINLSIDLKIIKKVQKSFKVTSAGDSDRPSLAAFKKVDPSILEVLLNIMFHTGYISPKLKKCKAIISKSGNISFLVLKLLNKISQRLNSTCSSQEGFDHITTSFTNTEILQNIIKEYRSRASPYNIVTLDLHTIFDATSNQNTAYLKSRAGIHSRVIDIIEGMLTGCTNIDKRPDYISIFKGLIINELLSSIDHQAGLELGKEKIAAFADADDMVILGPSKTATQTTLDHVSAFLRKRHLMIDVEKCAALSTMTVPRKKKLFYVTDSIFTIDNQPILQITPD